MFNLGGYEVLVVLLIILVLFGGSKLPELARSMGKAKTEFRRGIEDEETVDVEKDTREES